ncbi:MAG: type II secretion system F family protein [Candidatus Eremiobacteraeota bacterium]|nr:type II secretion system F family protein [Candidatus Eremiobacteraeota bacterium]
MVANWTIYPIVGVIAGAVGYIGWRFWGVVIQFITPYTEPYQARLERAGIKTDANDLAFRILAGSILLWGAYVFTMRPNVWFAFLALPACFALMFYGTGSWIKIRTGQRLEKFNNQLEIALRLMTSGLRAGLGLRQAMVVVVSEMPDPIRGEFNRVLNQTSIGVSIYDALDSFNERMPSQEMLMLTRAIRILSKTGGNLGKTLETLAETIKQRRRIDRKVRALTAEARASGFVMTALPIVVLLFIIAFEPQMRDDLLGSNFGRLMVVGALGLCGLGQYVMTAMSRIDV